MSTQALAPLSIVGAALGLSPDEIETTVQISADLSDAQIVLLHHAADLLTFEARAAAVCVEPVPVDETDLLSLAGVAALLDIPAAQVLDLNTRGQIPTFLNIPGVGRRWYAPAISKWIAGLPFAS